MLKGFSALAVQYVLNLYAMYVWGFLQKPEVFVLVWQNQSSILSSCIIKSL